MKKLVYGILFIFLFSFCYVSYASDNSSRDFDTTKLNEIIKGHNKPRPDGDESIPKPKPKPDNPGHHPQPQPQPQPIPTPQPKPPIDTTEAYNAGFRDGSAKGRIDGRRNGYSDGIRDGERDGEWRGRYDGERDGRDAGYRDGYNTDQSEAIRKGNIDGENAGINDGTLAGKRRCYDEGYTQGYNRSYSEGREAGLNDVSSYNSGYSDGQRDARTIEVEKGRKAGYEAGFAEREKEIEDSFKPEKLSKDLFLKNIYITGETRGISIDMARSGFTTPQEQEAYKRGYREGYQDAYRKAYNRAKKEGYNEGYNRTYSRAYSSQYSISYREAFNEGKEEGYQDAYNRAYNSAYDFYYDEYKKREYPDERARGMRDGSERGYKDGFDSGSREQYKKGYSDGYTKEAAIVYPSAFEEGRKAGRDAADKYYMENAVLKGYNLSFYDENGDEKFEANENVILKGEIRNWGYQKSDTVLVSVKNDRGEIKFVSDLKIDALSPRSVSQINLIIGKIYDVASPGSDTLYVTFTHLDKEFADYNQVYLRTNSNRVGIVLKDDTPVLKKATWFFPGTITKLNRGDKVLIIGDKDNYYKVRKSDFSDGSWSEGYIKKDKLALQ